MANILCINTGLTGILNASIALVKQLEHEGNSCKIACPLPVGKYVNAQGIDFLELPPINFDPAPQLPAANGIIQKIQRLLFKYRKRREREQAAINALGMTHFEDQIRKENPDLILIDMELHEHIMTLVAKNFNVKLLSQWFSTWNRRGLPPIVTDIIPGVGFSGSRFGIRMAWHKIKAQRWWMFLKRKLLSAGTDRRSILLKYADHVGFSRSYIHENYWPGPFSYARLPVLSMTNEALEFPHDKRPNLEYIGAMVYENRMDVYCPSETQTAIADVIKEKNQTGRKLIYCSVSTFKKGDIHFISKVIESVRNQEEWILIIALGGLLNSDFSNLPHNVFVFKYVPQLQVLKEADLSINHGGIHTINECLHFSVPMLVYSGKRSDQNGCAARVHFHKKGIRGDKDRESSNDIRQKIAHILDLK